eukprot:364942-Chlamydomonas_euryale.AAC.3
MTDGAAHSIWAEAVCRRHLTTYVHCPGSPSVRASARHASKRCQHVAQSCVEQSRARPGQAFSRSCTHSSPGPSLCGAPCQSMPIHAKPSKTAHLAAVDVVVWDVGAEEERVAGRYVRIADARGAFVGGIAASGVVGSGERRGARSAQ